MNFIDGLLVFSIVSLACSGFVDLVYDKGYSIDVIENLIFLWFIVGLGYFLLIS